MEINQINKILSNHKQSLVKLKEVKINMKMIYKNGGLNRSDVAEILNITTKSVTDRNRDPNLWTFQDITKIIDRVCF